MFTAKHRKAAAIVVNVIANHTPRRNANDMLNSLLNDAKHLQTAYDDARDQMLCNNIPFKSDDDSTFLEAANIVNNNALIIALRSVSVKN